MRRAISLRSLEADLKGPSQSRLKSRAHRISCNNGPFAGLTLLCVIHHSTIVVLAVAGSECSQEVEMAHPRTDSGSGASPYAAMKQMAGRRIEDERRRIGLSQRRLAALAGFSVSWVREIESGNPKVRIDDHLRCFEALQISQNYILIPLMFKARGRDFPPQLLVGDIRHIEDKLMDFVVDENLAHIRALLDSGRQRGQQSGHGVCAAELDEAVVHEAYPAEGEDRPD